MSLLDFFAQDRIMKHDFLGIQIKYLVGDFR